MIPLIQDFILFDAATATATKKITESGAHATKARSIILEMSSSGTWAVDIKGAYGGAPGDDGTYHNISYFQADTTVGNVSQAQISVASATPVYFVIPNPPPHVEIVATRSSGTLTVKGSFNSEAYAPTGLVSGGVSGTVTANQGAQGTATSQWYASLPPEWSVYHAPASNNIATISKAAGTGTQKHVVTSLSFVVTAGATPPTAGVMTVNLRDGATGAGTILKSWLIGVLGTAGASQGVSLSGLNVIGTAATAMTLEFTSTGSNISESVEMSGYTTA